MAKNTDKDYRKGEEKERSQTLDPKNDKWTKRDTATGEFTDQKADDKPFKGVRKEKERGQRAPDLTRGRRQ